MSQLLSRLAERLAPAAATVTGFVPLYIVLHAPARERLAARTLRWAPRWERNFELTVARAVPAVERGVQAVSGRVGDAVKRSEPAWRPRVERAVGAVAARLEKGVQWGVGLFITNGEYSLARPAVAVVRA